MYAGPELPSTKKKKKKSNRIPDFKFEVVRRFSIPVDVVEDELGAEGQVIKCPLGTLCRSFTFLIVIMYLPEIGFGTHLLNLIRFNDLFPRSLGYDHHA